MSVKACVEIIQKAAGENKITKEHAQEILKDIDNFLKSKKALNDPENLDSMLQQHLKEKLDDTIFAAMIEKRNRYINATVEAKATQYLKNFDDASEGLAALMGGIVKSKPGSKKSIDAQGKSLANKYIGRMLDRIDKDGDLALFNTGKIDTDIAKELWEIRPGGNPGVTKNKTAERIARNIHEMQETSIKNANFAGAYVKSRPGYIFRQSHDMAKIRKTGFDEWYDYIVDKLDESTFKGEDAREFLEGAYKGLASGVHKKFKGAEESNIGQGFTGPANLAKKISQERVLHFKDADSFMEYNATFGTGDLRESVVHGLEHMARNTALMRGLGTNPVAMMEKLQKKYMMQAQDEMDFKLADKFRARNLDSLMKEIDGTTRIPVKISTARVNSGIRAVQNMARLGGATISSITDLPNQVAELRHHGIPLLKGYGNSVLNLFRGRGTAEQKTIARTIGIGFDGITGDLLSRFSSTDHVPGMFAKMQQKFFKLNLMSWWNDAHRTGVGLMMSHNLGDSQRLTFDKLGTELSNLLRQYGIEDLEWNIYRKHLVSKDSRNYKFMTTENIDKIPDEELALYLKRKSGIDKPNKRELQDARFDLEMMLDTFYLDRADHGIPMPGAAERAIMNQGTQPGTAVGEVFRHVMQFKSFPITMIRRGLGREMRGTANGKADIRGLAQLIAGTTVFGYGALVAKDILKLREARQFTGDFENDSKLIMAAMAQGGGMGIYGDFLFGEFSRFGRSAVSTAVGPTLGQVDDLGELWTRIRTGGDVGANAFRMAMNNTPFINLFYTRAALDYIILYELQEMINPGYLSRMEQRIMRENNQKFFIPPTSVVR